MEALPGEVYGSVQVRAMDRYAIDDCGIPGYALMQRAAQAALALLRCEWPSARRIAVLCGAGNNGGDGYVLARLALAVGLEVQLAALVDPARLSGDAAQAWKDFHRAGGLCQEFTDAMLATADVIVDALLGTGLDRPVTGPLGSCIAATNAAGRPVLSLDLPSGLDADSGLVRGVAVHATRTITFVALKSGLYLGAGPDHSGPISFAGLGVPATARAEHAPLLRRMDQGLLEAALPRRHRTAHKGDHGRVLIVGGLAMAGAARLAGEAALRSGAGLVTVATRPAAAAAIVAGRPEIIAQAVRSTSALQALAAAADVIAVGPGLGLSHRARRFLSTVLAAGKPLIVDADALALIAADPQHCEHWILTPHPGEAGRLLGTDAAAVQQDRRGAVAAIVARYGGICVLKGAGTLVSVRSGAPWVCDRGNPGMATAGCGDVLTGVIAALVAQGADLELAAAAGVLVHSRAGDRAAAGGERGVLAGDLVEELRACVNPPWN
ncbi:MAG: NAD(P)H-hydrate dehydratase [Gammaproteobacteria bacterium]|nr:MAG: NAD(P)H-hydrate dehydratase [Gammaproteobacteria bacterium]